MKTATIQNDPAQARSYFGNKMSFTTGPVELKHEIDRAAEMVIVDVREAEDYQAGHIPGAINLPQDKWGTFQGLRRDKTNVLYCYSIVCHLAAAAAVQFAENGFPVKEMDGGFQAWKDNKFPIEK